MKKNYLFIAALCSTLTFAQQTISFEASDGYVMGDLNGQNGWTVTESSDGFITNQIITDEQASAGSYSFKNAHLEGRGPQWFPIIGAEKSFSTPLDYSNTTISYDFRAPKQLGSDFEFAVYGIDETTQTYEIMTAVGFENQGKVYLYTEPNFTGYLRTDAKWKANTWYTMQVQFTPDNIIYRLDGAVIHTAENTGKLNLIGINFLHNNYGGDAYYDNITINDVPLAVYDGNAVSLKVYPNPVQEKLQISLPATETIKQTVIYNMNGQKVKILPAETSVNVMNLSKGLYVIEVVTDAGRVYKSKFIKK